MPVAALALFAPFQAGRWSRARRAQPSAAESSTATERPVRPRSPVVQNAGDPRWAQGPHANRLWTETTTQQQLERSKM
eukprot:8951114-Alexandrium_andersonii.AAC.1